jgi:hypothetical protein
VAPAGAESCRSRRSWGLIALLVIGSIGWFGVCSFMFQDYGTTGLREKTEGGGRKLTDGHDILPAQLKLVQVQRSVPFGG